MTAVTAVMKEEAVRLAHHLGGEGGGEGGGRVRGRRGHVRHAAGLQSALPDVGLAGRPGRGRRSAPEAAPKAAPEAARVGVGGREGELAAGRAQGPGGGRPHGQQVLLLLQVQLQLLLLPLQLLQLMLLQRQRQRQQSTAVNSSQQRSVESVGEQPADASATTTVNNAQLSQLVDVQLVLLQQRQRQQSTTVS